jgi:hypothetical protein
MNEWGLQENVAPSIKMLGGASMESLVAIEPRREGAWMRRLRRSPVPCCLWGDFLVRVPLWNDVSRRKRQLEDGESGGRVGSS